MGRMGIGGWRARMGWRERGTFRLPTTIVEGTLKTDTIESKTANGTISVGDELQMATGEQLFIDAGSAAAPGLALVHAGVRDPNTGISGIADQVNIIAGAKAAVAAQMFNTIAGEAFQVSGGAFAPTRVVDVADLAAGPHHDLASWSLSVNSGVRQNLSANAVVTGAAGANLAVLAFVYNISAFTLTLNHEDANSAAANRFLCPGNVALVVPANGMALLRYDIISSRWRVL